MAALRSCQTNTPHPLLPPNENSLGSRCLPSSPQPAPCPEPLLCSLGFPHPRTGCVSLTPPHQDPPREPDTHRHSPQRHASSHLHMATPKAHLPPPRPASGTCPIHTQHWRLTSDFSRKRNATALESALTHPFHPASWPAPPPSAPGSPFPSRDPGAVAHCQLCVTAGLAFGGEAGHTPAALCSQRQPQKAQ